MYDGNKPHTIEADDNEYDSPIIAVAHPASPASVAEVLASTDRSEPMWLRLANDHVYLAIYPHFDQLHGRVEEDARKPAELPDPVAPTKRDVLARLSDMPDQYDLAMPDLVEYDMMKPLHVAFGHGWHRLNPGWTTSEAGIHGREEHRGGVPAFYTTRVTVPWHAVNSVFQREDES